MGVFVVLWNLKNYNISTGWESFFVLLEDLL